MLRRPRLLRATGIGATGLALAGVLVVGVGVPANAAQLEDLHSYQLTAPAGVTHLGDGETTRAWRDVARNYSTEPTLYPVTDVSTLSNGGKNLYGNGGGVQLVQAEDGSYDFRHTGSNPWPVGNGRPPHVPEIEWAGCSGSDWGVMAALRNLSRSLAGADDCQSIRAGWGVPMDQTWLPVGAAGGFPVTLSSASGSVSVGQPVFSLEPYAGNVLGWLYPVSVDFDLTSVYATRISFTQRWVGDGGTSGTLGAAGSEMQILSSGNLPTSRGGNVSALAADLCGATVACLNPSHGRLSSGERDYFNGGSGVYLAGLNVTVCRTSMASTCSYVPGPGDTVDTPVVPLASLLGAGPAVPPTLDGEEPEPVKIGTTVTLEDGSKYSCDGEQFIEKLGERIPLPCFPPGIPPGSKIGGFSVGVGPPGGGEGTKIGGSAAGVDYTGWQASDPECSNGSRRCVLDLVKSGTSCFDEPTGCEDWKDAPPSSGFECQYDGKPRALSDCDVYGPTFKPEARDGGGAYAPKPGDGAGSTSKPFNSGGMKGPLVGDGECFSEGWAPSNPVDWVMKPVQCALEWALVPSDGAVEAAQGKIGNAYAASGAGALGDALKDASSMFAVGSSCDGLPFNIHAFGVEYSGRLFEACAAPWNGVANFTNNLLVGVTSFAGFLAVWRYLAAAFSFVGPGGSLTEDRSVVNNSAKSGA